MVFSFFEKILGKKEKAEKAGGGINNDKKNKTKESQSGSHIAKIRQEYESSYPEKFLSGEERILISREKTIEKRVGHGITHPIYVELKDDGAGIFKDEEYKNERAAYLIDRFLGFDFVPPTVIREINGETGSMQRFITDAKMAGEIKHDELLEHYKDELMKLWIFDVIIGNRDRHGGNFLVKNEKIYAIDHGFSLSFNGDSYREDKDNEIWNDCSSYEKFYNEKFSDEIIGKFKGFLEWENGSKILKELLSEIIREDNASACVERIKYVGDILIKNGKIPKSVTGYN